MSAMPPRCHRERELRLLPVDETTVQLPIGAPVSLVGGTIVAPTAGTLAGFLAEPTDPSQQPEFSQGGAVAGAGGAFTVDVHPGNVLVQVADSDATFIVDYWGAGGGATGPAEPAATLIGTAIQLTANDLTGQVAVAADAALTGAGAVDAGTIALVKSIYEAPQGANTPGEPSGYSRLEIQINSGVFIP